MPHGFGVRACGAGASVLPAHRFRTQCCCPVSVPDWSSRGRLRCFVPAAMQASCCSPVSASLYSLEAAARRARERSCAGVLGSIGLAQRRRHCLLPRMYHTQSPHRPLLITGSRHSPDGPHHSQRLHRSGVNGPGTFAAARALELLAALVFMLRRWTPTPPWTGGICTTIRIVSVSEQESNRNLAVCPPQVSQKQTVFHPKEEQTASVGAAAQPPQGPCGAATVRLRRDPGVSPMLIGSTWETRRGMTGSTLGSHRCSCLGSRSVRAKPVRDAIFSARGLRGIADPPGLNAEGRIANAEFRPALMSASFTLHSAFFVFHLKAPPKHCQRCTRPVRESQPGATSGGGSISIAGRAPAPQSSQRSGRFHTPAVPRAALGIATICLVA